MMLALIADEADRSVLDMSASLAIKRDSSVSSSGLGFYTDVFPEEMTMCAACRHPASGYVQGINDLVTPFLAVFLSAHFDEDAPMEEWEVGLILHLH